MRRDTIEAYRDRARRWRWRYVAHNGHVLADSGQSYSRRIDAIAAARRVTGLRLRSLRITTPTGTIDAPATLPEDTVTRGVPAEPWTPERPTRYGD